MLRIDADEIDTLVIHYGGIPYALPVATWLARVVQPGYESLSDVEALQMRVRYHIHGIDTRTLAESFGMSRRQVFRVVGGESFPHLPMPGDDTWTHGPSIRDGALS
ncbi:MAG: hypothetical protein AAFQ53_16680 [Bacteroidota bacterium]